MSYIGMVANVKYQKQAVDLVVKKAIDTILSGQRIARQFIIAPTGSGKTVMAAAVIERLVQREMATVLKKKVRVIFITHSKTMADDFSEKFKQMNASVASVDDIENKVYNKTSVLLSNPEKFSEAAKQGKDFLEKWLGNPEDEVRILVMDEGDVTHDGKRNQLIKSMIEPDVEICWSATFDSKKDEKNAEKSGRDKSEILHRIAIDEVIASGMIVHSHEYLVNVENATFGSIMKLAVDKQNELITLAQRLPLAEIHIPKVVIQSQSSEIEDVLKQLSDFLKETYDLKLTPEMYCIIKQGLDEQSIKDKDLIRFYIGDQLISRGWDSPQSRIIVSFKQSSDMAVGIQLLGRVSRMPFQKHFSEEFDALNKGYVYVNGTHSLVQAVNSYITTSENLASTNTEKIIPVKMVKVSSLKPDIKVPEVKTYIKRERTPTKDSVINEISDYIKEKFMVAAKGSAVEHSVSRKEIDSQTGEITHIGKEDVQIEVSAALHSLKSALVAKGFPEDVANDALSNFIQDDQCRKEWKHYHKVLADEIDFDQSKLVLELLSKIDFETETYVFTDKTVSKDWNKKWKRCLYEYEEMGDKEAEYADELDSFCEKNNLYWTKNVEKKQCRLPIGYYPDFIIFNENKYLFTEYKGNHLLGNADTNAKIAYGETSSPRVYMIGSKGNDFVVVNSDHTETILKDIEQEILKGLN